MRKVKEKCWTFDGETIKDQNGEFPLKKENGHLVAAAPEMLDLLKRLNEDFYVKGKWDSLAALMKETKPLIRRAEGRA